MNLKRIRYFCEIVDAGSVVQAAERLFVASTAISMQISQLEAHLGGELFDRSRRPMALTQLGKFFYPRAKELLAEARRLDEEAHGIATGKRGWLGIGFVQSAIFSFLPKAIRTFHATYPDVKLDLIEVLSDYQPAYLREGRIHIGISRFIGAVDSPADLVHRVIRDDAFMAVLPINHPLASKTALCVAELNLTPFIVYPKDPLSVFGQKLVSLLNAAGEKPVIAYEAIEIHTALALVAAGLGWTLVGHSIAENARNDVVFVPVKDIETTSTIMSVTRVDEDSKLADAFLSILMI